MEVNKKIKNIAAVACLVMAAAFFIASMQLSSLSSDLDHIADKTSKIVSKRLAILNKYMIQAKEGDLSEFLRFEDLPEDMVIYRYCDDTLQSWVHHFSVPNDAISNKMIFQSITGSKYGAVFPLSSLTEKYSYQNLGPKLYLARVIDDGKGCKIVGGLEIVDELVDDLGRGFSGINPKLQLSGIYSIETIANDDGVAVSIGETPLFKISPASLQNTPLFANTILCWIALLFLLASLMLLLWIRRSFIFFVGVAIFLWGTFVISYYWGSQMQLNTPLFSPSVYAGGEFLYSLGALEVLILHAVLFIFCAYIIRRRLWEWVESKHTKFRTALYTGVIVAAIAAIAVFIHFSFKSLIMNSNISLDFMHIIRISWFTVLVYLGYFALLLGMLALLKMLNPVMKKLNLPKKEDVFSRGFRLFFAFLWALYFCLMTSVVGFEKEVDRVMVWSNRLAVDRDLETEILLRSVENVIASDVVVSNLLDLPGGNSLVLNRLSDSYFMRISQNYDISVSVCQNDDPECLVRFEKKMRSGDQIYPGSHFVYSYDQVGRSSYLGLFAYHSQQKGVVRMLIELDFRSNVDNRDFYTIFGRGQNDTKIPEYYSYGKFIDEKLVGYKGTYAYPMSLTAQQMEKVLDQRCSHYVEAGNLHFINRIADDEVIIVTRPQRSAIATVLSFAILMILIYAGLMVVKYERTVSPDKMFKKNSYRNRINTMISLVLVSSMVVLTLFSITFVIQRNDNNMKNMMSSRLQTIQALIEAECKGYEDYRYLSTQEFNNVLEEIAKTTKSDISLYTVGGLVFNTTMPDAFDKMLVGRRMNEDAYYNILHRNQRFYIHKENFAGRVYYSLYSPIFNSEGEMLAILGAPYADQDNFTRDAIIHMATLIIIFFILLVISLSFSSAVISAMFKPLMNMARKLTSTSIDHLEYMDYSGDDEVSALVESYNRMVEKLDESMKQVTQAERDKAWSEMARQVAHEIKNPLTPMNLAIQRLIRLKEKNAPNWDEKFKESSRVILEQIAILSDTANEFSTFAKLYSEEPVEIDLDKMLQDQITMFDNRDDVKIMYIGLKDAMISGPRPQLIRVFVNLISNAIQAVEHGSAAYSLPKLGEDMGLVMVCLRNSTKEGFYDIVIEDNGSGVSEENMSKLFTPKFTTKSSGTGLGLAICKNILEKCGGEISYQRSHLLKGACFTVRLPKLN